MDKKNSESMFVGLLTPEYYKIHSFILTLVPNQADAEDVLQSSISYMWEHFNDFKVGTNFLSWAFTISKFHVLTYRRNKSRSKLLFCDEVIELVEAENQKISEQADVRYNALNKCMKKMRSEDLYFIKKRYEKKTKVKDIAAEMGLSANVVYKRIAQIKSLLLKCIRLTMAHGEIS